MAVRRRYRLTFGPIPTGIERRLTVAESTGRLDDVEAIEALRHPVLAGSSLHPRVSSWSTSASC